MPEQTQENNKQALAVQEPRAVQAAPPRAGLREMLSIIKDAGLMDVMGRELVEREVAAALYDEDARVARMFAQSGYFSDIKGEDDQQSIAKAMTKLQLGRSWNMVPADAIQHIYLVNGRPAVQNEYLASKMRDAGLDWDIEWMRDVNGDCIGCKLWPSRLAVVDGTTVFRPILERVNGEQVPASVSFTKAQADKIRIKEGDKWINLSEKATYQSYAEDMYFWRCIARLRRRYATNVLSGVLTRSEAEEIEPAEIQKALPAPAPEPKPLVDMMPSGAARGRAGKKDIPGTVPQSGGDKPPYEPAAKLGEPSVVAEDIKTATADPLTKESVGAARAKQEPKPAEEPVSAKTETSTYQQVVAIGKKHGQSWFVRTLFELSPKLTPETLTQVKPEAMVEVLAYFQKMDVAESAPRKGLF